MWRPQGRKLGKVTEVAEWNGEVNGVLAKGGRICWEVASSRSKKSGLVEREAREGFWRAGIVGGRSLC